MLKNSLIKMIAKIVETKINHLTNATKKVYLKSGVVNNLMQFASAEFKKMDFIEPHMHNTMTEVFYVEFGKIKVTLNNDSFIVNTEDVFVVSSKVIHSFKFIENTKIVYFGINDTKI